MNDELQRYLGIAAVIFAALFGLGSCAALGGLGQNLAGKEPMIKMVFK